MKRAFCLVLSFAFIGGCSRRLPQATESQLKGVVRTNLDSPQPTPEQLARRSKNTAAVRAAGLPTMDGLPVVEDEKQIKPRTKDEVVSRCLATVFCAIKGESNDGKLVDQLVERYSAETFFSPRERSFLRDPSPTKQELADFAWRYECVHVFLWALGYLPHLNAPNEIADVKRDVGIIRVKGPGSFAKDAKLRPLAEVLDQADLYYRLDWAATELRLKGQKNPKADGEIIEERHRALNWLIRYMNQDWDDVKTDT